MGIALDEQPHEGSLDYALSTCNALQKLRLPWQLVSSAFLGALAQMPDLEWLVMDGHPLAAVYPNDLSKA